MIRKSKLSAPTTNSPIRYLNMRKMTCHVRLYQSKFLLFTKLQVIKLH